MNALEGGKKKKLWAKSSSIHTIKFKDFFKYFFKLVLWKGFCLKLPLEACLEEHMLRGTLPAEWIHGKSPHIFSYNFNYMFHLYCFVEVNSRKAFNHPLLIWNAGTGGPGWAAKYFLTAKNNSQQIIFIKFRDKGVPMQERALG